jgi:hypothetical protein
VWARGFSSVLEERNKLQDYDTVDDTNNKDRKGATTRLLRSSLNFSEARCCRQSMASLVRDERWIASAFSELVLSFLNHLTLEP